MASSSSSRGKKPGGIHTLSDLNRRSGGDPDTNDNIDGDGNPQEYYTGGEKSGMLVQDPSKFNEVDAIFNQARRLGAVEDPVDHSASSSSPRFSGTGRLLSGEIAPSSPQQPQAVIHNIVFWTNGFTVNDGPLRRLDDPENAPFLESIRKSECPKELEPEDRRSSVHVKLIRRDEACPEPEKMGPVPFQGVGRTLGGSSSGGPVSVSVPATGGASSGPIVDQSLPSTSIQIRLADGTRMVIQVNFHHTVGDLRGAISASRPAGPQNYQLQVMGFPPKVLTDPNQTIEQACLANSVIIQKL